MQFQKSNSTRTDWSPKQGDKPPKQGDSLSKPVQSAFKGDVEIYNINPTREIDLLAYLISVKPEIDEIVQKKTSHGTQTSKSSIDSGVEAHEAKS